MTNNRQPFTTPESGLTLIEMLMAVSILVIIGGSAYFAFKTAVDGLPSDGDKDIGGTKMSGRYGSACNGSGKTYKSHLTIQNSRFTHKTDPVNSGRGT